MKLNPEDQARLNRIRSCVRRRIPLAGIAAATMLLNGGCEQSSALSGDVAPTPTPQNQSRETPPSLRGEPVSQNRDRETPPSLKGKLEPQNREREILTTDNSGEPVLRTAGVMRPPKAARTVEGRQYEAKPGDSFWKIAVRFGVASDELMKVNGGTEKSLRPGQIVQIPAGMVKVNYSEKTRKKAGIQ